MSKNNYYLVTKMMIVKKISQTIHMPSYPYSNTSDDAFSIGIRLKHAGIVGPIR